VTPENAELREIWLDRKADHSSQPSSLEFFLQEAKRWGVGPELPFIRWSDRPIRNDGGSGPMCPLRSLSRNIREPRSGPEARTLASSVTIEGVVIGHRHFSARCRSYREWRPKFHRQKWTQTGASLFAVFTLGAEDNRLCITSLSRHHMESRRR